MKKLEKFAIVLIVLWILQAIAAGATPFWIRHMLEAKNVTAGMGQLKILTGFFALIIGLGTSVACGIWLFLEAKRESRPRWLWCLAGLNLKINAVILFFVWLAFQEIRQMRIKNDVNPDGNIGSDTDTVK